jgi:hypothetical protein
MPGVPETLPLSYVDGPIFLFHRAIVVCDEN